jgi:hypothetical protein
MIIKTIYNLVRYGWKSINTEQRLSMAGIVQRLSMAGIVIGMVMIVYAFHSNYGLYIGVSGYVLTLFCSVGYGLFKYFPILKRSKQKIPQKTINDYVI